MAKASYVAGFVLAALFFIRGIQLCACRNSTSGACIQRDRNALLKLKASLRDPSNLLSSWEGQDCCRWKGVSCNQTTGHVIKLHLSSSNSNPYSWCWYNTQFPNYSDRLGLGKVDLSLMELKHLKYLDLSGNNFQASEIPKFFGFLNKLRYLNLSCTNFTGKVPHQLGNLTNLQVLDLGSGEQVAYADDFQWSSSLLSLQHLDMSRVDLGSAHNLMEVLTRLPSLLNVKLSHCGINDTHFKNALVNSTFIASIQLLDLSYNDLQTPIPSALQNMSFLRVLDLSYNYLQPPILSALQNMSLLRVLDISGNSFNSSVPLWLGNLKSLVTLNLVGNEFDSIEGGLSSLINNYCHLKSLDLSGNQFDVEALVTGQNLSTCGMHSLESLSLGDNDFGGKFPNWFGQLRGLKHLYLSRSSLHGPIPSSLGNLSNLRVVDLSYNQLNGTIPSSLGNLSNLRVVDLSYNQLNGTIPSSLGNLSNLRVVDLSYNQLNGTIPSSLGNLSNLRVVNLSSNQLNGIPNSLGRLSMLRELHVRDNQLGGVIPRSLGQLVNLEVFDISNNSLEGTLSEIHFSNLSRLKELGIGNNYNLTFKVSSDWIPPFSLQEIHIENCKIDGSEWLRTQEVKDLSLRNTGILGSFPMWLLSMPLSSLDLSMNQLSGPLPSSIGDDMPALEFLYISGNLINGSIPNSLCRLNNLLILDLSRNMLHGQIPHCWADSLRIRYIDLSSNQLSGTIPGSLCNLPLLHVLHVNNNSLSGTLPLAMRNCTQLLSMDLGENRLSGVIPTWIGENYLHLQILRLRENTFTGSIPLSLCRLSRLGILDIACNHLIGRIPLCFNNLSRMTTTATLGGSSWYLREKVVEVMKGQSLEYTNSNSLDGRIPILLLVLNMDLSSNNLVGRIPQQLTTLDGLLGLNLSHNHLSGSIPQQIGNMKALFSLDFSDNQISGTIPDSMSNLTFLSYLNLSYNNLSGKIPKGNQLQTLTDPTIYAGNQLCGDPLPKCASDGEQVQPPISIGAEDEEQGEGRSEKFWFYFVVSCGYATGLSGVFWILMVKKNWRIAYFRYADKGKDWVQVMVAVQVARLKRKMEGNNNGTE